MNDNIIDASDSRFWQKAKETNDNETFADLLEILDEMRQGQELMATPDRDLVCALCSSECFHITNVGPQCIGCGSLTTWDLFISNYSGLPDWHL